MSAALDPPLRVLHFVTGGFSGATQVALDLVQAARASPGMAPLLVLRRKRQTDPARVEALREAGVPVETVPGWSHAATVWSLVQVCRRFTPDVLIAHGFSEHLWGRYAGLIAGVPHLVHVEHNSRERYTRWRLAQARWLARRSDRLVGVSEGVAARLRELGFPAERVVAIGNGIDLEAYAQADAQPMALRKPALLMSARFSRQKDHPTLVRALALLKAGGHRPPLLFAGTGSRRHRERTQRLATELGVAEQVEWLGQRSDMPQLLMTTPICVLATHYEGMPLALLEGMAAGCAVVASAVPGVRELIEHGRTGLLVAEGDARAMADALSGLLDDPVRAAALGAAARRRALDEHGRALMVARYQQMLVTLRSGPALGANGR